MIYGTITTLLEFASPVEVSEGHEVVHLALFIFISFSSLIQFNYNTYNFHVELDVLKIK